MFETSQTKIAALIEGTKVLASIRTMYAQAKALQILLARYTAGTDAVFIASVNGVYTAQERAEINAVLTKVNAFVTDLETNNKQIIGI